VLIVSDGSTDRTAETALAFARDNQLYDYPEGKLNSGAPGSGQPHDRSFGAMRVISLRENRGKGGAVVHGMRHVRGKYVLFADADGASRFEDLVKLIQACQKLRMLRARVAVGSRAHLVGSEAVVKVRRPSTLYVQCTDICHYSVLFFVTC
jgi:dolichyl-phosphate beta-glucosyltransferase